jgi:hypothetical protein
MEVIKDTCPVSRNPIAYIVSLEAGEFAKARGFNWPCDYYYNKNFNDVKHYYLVKNSDDNNNFTLPTYHQFLNWCWYMWSINVIISPDFIDGTWKYSLKITYEFPGITNHIYNNVFEVDLDAYEKATEVIVNYVNNLPQTSE